MKFFNWMQNKLNSGHGNKTFNTNTSACDHKKQEPKKEEFNDWPQGLLTIGTFGNNDQIPRAENDENQETDDNMINTASSSPDLSEFTPEEIGKLQKELTKLLSKKPAVAADLPLDRFLNCPSNLEVDRRLSTTVITNPDDKEEIDRTVKVILGRCKDICTENGKKAIGKRSFSLLLKKMFVCSSGLPPMPSVQDRLPESRMERLLRAMLKNKINPNSSRAVSGRKLIETRKSPKSPKKGKGKAATDRDNDEDANDGSTWVKTDSEYIVLEI
ncbi:protein NEGATIVE GRAVITROPIC RESPONSE OF ROOTS-like [Rutidosis leptorrhynchoides]|uniref:protein NEGATIVE GRAVITROPIC RESPONSE OF ROOTS-like n=1 Tax=Rutidosis leptorrhynchoides TaxID=125765 RepID=UPI003A998B14